MFEILRSTIYTGPNRASQWESVHWPTIADTEYLIKLNRYLKTIILKTKLFNNLLKYQLLFQQNKYKIVKKMSSGFLMYFKRFKICEEFGIDI